MRSRHDLPDLATLGAGSRGLALATSRRVRSIVLLSLVAIATVVGVVKTLPEGEAKAAVRPGRPREVQSVAIDGRGLPIAALRAVMSTHAGDMLDATKLDTDRAAIESALVARGYLT